MNVGPENREPARQIGYAQSSLSPAASSKSELEAAVAGLLKIKKAHPEYDAALHAAIQVMTDQDFTIDFLSRALADVRCQLKSGRFATPLCRTSPTSPSPSSLR